MYRHKAHKKTLYIRSTRSLPVLPHTMRLYGYFILINNYVLMIYAVGYHFLLKALQTFTFIMIII